MARMGSGVIMKINPERYERGDVAVEWYNADEGLCGQYDSNDPEDVNLLRFDFYGKKNGRWLPVNDGSYCTAVPADTPSTVLARLLEVLMDRGEDAVQDALAHDQNTYDDEIDSPGGHILEELSWIDPTWANNERANNE